MNDQMMRLSPSIVWPLYQTTLCPRIIAHKGCVGLVIAHPSSTGKLTASVRLYTIYRWMLKENPGLYRVLHLDRKRSKRRHL
jgi:hypothetical protein